MYVVPSVSPWNSTSSNVHIMVQWYMKAVNVHIAACVIRQLLWKTAWNANLEEDTHFELRKTWT